MKTTFLENNIEKLCCKTFLALDIHDFLALDILVPETLTLGWLAGSLFSNLRSRILTPHHLLQFLLLQFVNLLTCQLVNLSTCQHVNLSTRHLVNLLTGHLVHLSPPRHWPRRPPGQLRCPPRPPGQPRHHLRSIFESSPLHLKVLD